MGQKFPSTQWSQLIGLKGEQPELRRASLDRLASQYWQPVHDYVCALRGPSEARDLTQQFFVRLLSGERLSYVSPERGSFRGFLKTSLRNFLINVAVSEASRPRGDANAAELPIKDKAPSAEDAFDRAWAKSVMDASVARLREELTERRRPHQFEIFEAYYLADATPKHDELASRFGITTDQVNHHLREGRARLRQIVRRVLREQVASPEDLEQELKLILAGE